MRRTTTSPSPRSNGPAPGDGIAAGAALLAVLATVAGPVSAGILEVHRENPRWLTDDGGETALVLSGAHTWTIFQDHDPEPPFDAVDYLDTLAKRGHNFTRGWFWEDSFYSPSPYARVGGLYRLSPPYEKAFVKRLRQRIRRARREGLFVSVMLFQGWSMNDQGGLRDPDPWPRNPYNRANTDEGVSKQQAALHIGRAQGQQLAYVAHVADKLCREPNIFWEVANETHPDSFGNANASNWQQNILDHLRSICDRHLTWVSCPSVLGRTAAERSESNEDLYSTSAEVVSPCDPDGSFVFDPPAADGRKVVVADSDHYGPDNISYEWVWKAFLRGQHPAFMDVTQPLEWWTGKPWDPGDNRWAKVYRALGAVQELVASVNKTRPGRAASALEDLVPQASGGGKPGDRTRPVSSRWTLYSSDKPCKRTAGGACGNARANGDEFLAYAEASEALSVCRLGVQEPYRYRWKRSRSAGYLAPAAIALSDTEGCLRLTNPADTVAVLHLERTLEKTAGAS